jgi:hypothetical protein
MEMTTSSPTKVKPCRAIELSLNLDESSARDFLQQPFREVDHPLK